MTSMAPTSSRRNKKPTFSNSSAEAKPKRPPTKHQSITSSIRNIETDLVPLKQHVAEIEPLKKDVQELMQYKESMQHVGDLEKQLQLEQEPKLPQDTFSFFLTSPMVGLPDTIFISRRSSKDDDDDDSKTDLEMSREFDDGENVQEQQEQEQGRYSKYNPFLWAVAILGVQLFIYSIVLQAFVNAPELPMGVTNLIVAAQVRIYSALY